MDEYEYIAVADNDEVFLSKDHYNLPDFLDEMKRELNGDFTAYNFHDIFYMNKLGPLEEGAM